MKGGTPGKGVTPGAEGYHAKVGVGCSRKMGWVFAKEDEGMVPAKEDRMGGVAEGNTTGKGNKKERHY